jgi:hypothetical protein
MSTFSLPMLRALFLATIMAGTLAGSAMAQAPDAGCALPSELEGVAAALDAILLFPNVGVRPVWSPVSTQEDAGCPENRTSEMKMPSR